MTTWGHHTLRPAVCFPNTAEQARARLKWAGVLILIVLKEIDVNRQLPGPFRRVVTALACGTLAVLAWDVSTSAQDRLKTMPGYAQYQKMSAQLGGAVRLAAVSGTWSADSSGFDYVFDGKRYRFDAASRSASETGAATDAAPAGRGGRGGGRGGTGIERGRQAASADAPDGKLKAFYRDRNLWVSDASGGNESAITSDGNDKDRIKYGTASWVYGEELAQTSAMWWSPDSRRSPTTASTRSKCPITTCSSTRRRFRASNDVEAYPKAGAPNPIVDLFVYDVATKKSTTRRRPRRQALRQHRRRALRLSRGVVAGRHASCCSTARTAGRTSWSSLLPTPTPARRRVIIREEWPTGWVENRPPMQFLKDSKPLHLGVGAQRLANFYLYDSRGQAHHAADDAHDVRGRAAS